MKSPAFRLAPLFLLAATPRLLAHPGHEGHELTWDLGHLASHPLATLGCVAVVVAATVLAWRAVRRAPSVQPLRRD